jgi:hypothetical protein
LKNTIVILLFTALLVQSFSKTLAVADYLVNMETYKKNCINKAKPMLHCNGKCQMLKKMKKQGSGDTAEAPVLKLNQIILDWSSKTYFPSLLLFPISIANNFYTIHCPITSSYIGSIFHPPGISII